MSKRTFSHTELKAYQQCPKKWWFRYQERIVKEYKKNVLRFGTIVHKCLAEYHKYGVSKSLELYDKLYKEALSLIDDVEQLKEFKEQKSVGAFMLNNYFENNTLKDFEVVFIEKRFKVPVITGSGRASTVYEYVFYPDMVVEDKYGKLWIVEHKTAASINSQYISALQLDDQVTRYMWGLEEWYRQKGEDKEVAGVLYNILRKKEPRVPKVLKRGGLSKRKNIDSNYETYMKAIKDNGLDPEDYKEILDRLKDKGDTFFEPLEILRNKKEKAEGGRQLYILANTINANPPIYTCPAKSCSWKCDYRILCVEDTPEARSTYMTVQERREKKKERLKKVEERSGNKKQEVF